MRMRMKEDDIDASAHARGLSRDGDAQLCVSGRRAARCAVGVARTLQKCRRG